MEGGCSMTRMKRLQELTLLLFGAVLLASLMAIPAITETSTFTWAFWGR
jgi:hypothetical protein